MAESYHHSFISPVNTYPFHVCSRPLLGTGNTVVPIYVCMCIYIACRPGEISRLLLIYIIALIIVT